MDTLTEESMTVEQLIEALGEIDDKSILVTVFDGMNVVEFNVLGVDEDDGVCWINVERDD